MPGTVPQGSANRALIGTSWPPTLPIDYMQGWELGNEAETSKEEFYHNDPAITTVGEPTLDGTFSGKVAYGGPGLALAAAASLSQELIYMAAASDGTNGIGSPGRISRYRETGPGRRQAANYSFNFVQDGAIMNLGAGRG